jgi:natural product biosynthesis luciferase-like monooxygenase protein
MRFDHYILNIYVPERDGPHEALYANWIEQALLAEALGYDTLWATEHHFRNFGGMCPNPQLLLAALATVTRRMRLGTAVTMLPLHNPMRIAEDMAMLDTLSGGRLEVGIGRGMAQTDFDVFGTRPEDTQGQLEEAIGLIRRAWEGMPFEWHGTHYEIASPIKLMPTPVQKPSPPVWCAATSEAENFRWIGRQGFNLMTLPWLGPGNERTRELIAIWRAALAEAGHDPATRELLVMYCTHVAENPADAEKVARAWLGTVAALDSRRVVESVGALTYERAAAETRWIIGDAAQCREQVAFIAETFAPTHIALLQHFGSVDYAGALGSMRRFAAEVAPRFR